MVSEYYYETIGVISSGILEYRRPGEVLNNNKIGSGFEVTPERQNQNLTKN